MLFLYCRSPADVNNLLSNVQYSGLTPLATALQAKVLQPIVFNLAAAGQLQKPVLIIAITDGEPTDNPRDLVVQVGGASSVHMVMLSPPFRADLSLRKHVGIIGSKHQGMELNPICLIMVHLELLHDSINRSHRCCWNEMSEPQLHCDVSGFSFSVFQTLCLHSWKERGVHVSLAVCWQEPPLASCPPNCLSAALDKCAAPITRLPLHAKQCLLQFHIVAAADMQFLACHSYQPDVITVWYYGTVSTSMFCVRACLFW